MSVRPRRKSRGAAPRRRAVFLDRDGTLVEERHYISRPSQLRLFKRVPRALALLRRAGFKLVLVSNQSGVGRGYFDLKALALVNARLRFLLRRGNARLDAVYFCPHAPSARCSCRKPKPGLVYRAVRDMNLDLRRSFMVGDNLKDVQLGRRLRIPSVLVLTGYGRGVARAAKADFTARDLLSAARWILRQA